MPPALSVPRHPDVTVRRERRLAELARHAATPGSARSTLQLALEMLVDDLETSAAAFWEAPQSGRIRLTAAHGWPQQVSGAEYPVAPDSQAAYVLDSDRAVCAHQATETRFTPSSMLVDLGFVRTL